MTNTDWIDLLRLIPEQEHNKLVITTLSGVDLNIDTILRTEESFIAFRGRVSGITDEGRVFFVPYRQIDFVQINRQVKEAEVRELFGEAPLAEAATPPSGVFAAITPTSGSAQGIAASPASPSASAPAAPTRPAQPGIAARLSGIHNPGRGSNGSHPPANVDAPTPPRNSILERLRAQRNSVITKPGR